MTKNQSNGPDNNLTSGNDGTSESDRKLKLRDYRHHMEPRMDSLCG
jgi:hypothetical protein